MALQCPRCGAAIPAKNINIQETLAVCPACDHVFRFQDSIPARKSSQPKFQRPDRLGIREGDGLLELFYWPLFGFEGFWTMLIFVLSALLWTGVTVLVYFDKDEPIHSLLIVGFVSAASWCSSIFAFTATTRIRMDEDILAVQRGSSLFPIKFTKRLSCADIAEIYYEETERSRNRNHVCVRLADGNRIILVKSLPQDFAAYITQELRARLLPENNTEFIPPGDEFYADSSQEKTAAPRLSSRPNRPS